MSTYVVGLDLGQASDYSALVVVERREQLSYDPAQVTTMTTYGAPSGLSGRRDAETRRVIMGANGSVTYVDELPGPQFQSYDVRHILRFNLGSPYPNIVRDVCDLLHRPTLGDDVRLVIDATGVGRPVVDMFNQHPGRRFPIVPVVITAGNAATLEADTGYWHVPKRDLVSVVQVQLQNKTLRFPEAAKMPAVDLLTHELGAFQYKITAAGNDTYGAWRERDHDDLVLALAVALWHADTRSSVGAWL